MVVGPVQAQAVLRTPRATMLQKLQLLVVDMAHRGAAWPPAMPDIQRMVRGVEEALRAAAAQQQAASGQGGAAGSAEEAVRAATRERMARAMAGYA